MRIRADPDPKHWREVPVSVLHGICCLGMCEFFLNNFFVIVFAEMSSWCFTFVEFFIMVPRYRFCREE